MAEASPPSACQEDAELAARAADKDPQAERALVVRILGHVRRTVRAIQRSAHEAEDALQLSMIEILRSAGSYRGEGSLERWAGRIAARTTLHLARQVRARGELALPEAELAQIPAPAHTDGRDITPATVQAHLATLPETRRTCLILRYMHGYTIDEIAELTKASPNTVKDRLLEGRAQLRKAIRRDEEASDRAAAPRRAR